MTRTSIPAIRLCALAACVGLILASLGCNEDLTGVNGFQAEEPFSYAVEVTSQTLVTLNGVNGNIRFDGVAGLDSVHIEGIRRVTSSSREDAEAHLADLEVVVDTRTDEVGIETVQPSSSGNRNYVVEYQITMPSDLMARVDNANGEIRIDSIENTVRVQNANGNLIIYDIVGSVIAQTANGNVDCLATLPAAGTLSLTTGNGNIGLLIPVETSAQFSAAVGNGNISLAHLSLQDQTITANLVTGRLGSGDGQISLTTGNGNIAAVGF
jgi:hypothetical protein